MKGLIFTWLLTLVGVSTSFINPYYGFLAYVALAILRPDFLWSSHISGGRFSLIVAGAMLLNWLFRCCGNWNLGPARRIVLLFTGSWMWAVFLALQADSPQHAWYYVEQQAKILLPFLVGITTVRSVEDLKKLAWVIVVCEGYVAFEMNVWYFSGYNYLWHIGFGSVDNNSAAIGFVTSLGVAFFLFFNQQQLWRRAVITFFAAMLGHAILFSFSRGAMLATAIFLVISFFIIQKTTLHYVIFGFGMVAGLILAGPEVRDRFLDTFASDSGVREASAQSRVELWKDCFELLMRNPILGCGPDHWPLHSHEFGWFKGKEAHSLWVQTTTELGIPGILMFMGFYVATIWRCWLFLKRVRSTADPWFTDAARMTIAALVGFMVAAQFVSLEALEIPYYVALLGAGSLAVYSRTLVSDDPRAATEFDVPVSGTECPLGSLTAQAWPDGAGFTDNNDLPGSGFSGQPADDPALVTAGMVAVPAFLDLKPPAPDWRDRISEERTPESGESPHIMVLN